MQAVDVRMQNLPVNPEDPKQTNVKQTKAEPVRNGDSFLAILKKTIACPKDGGCEVIGKKIQTEKTQKEAGTYKTGKNLHKDKAGTAGILENTGKKLEKKIDKPALKKDDKGKISFEKTGNNRQDEVQKAEKHRKDFKKVKAVKPNPPEKSGAELHENKTDNRKAFLLSSTESGKEKLDNAGKAEKKKQKPALKNTDEKLFFHQQNNVLNLKQAEPNLNSQSDYAKTKKNSGKRSKPVFSVEDLRTYRNTPQDAVNNSERAGSLSDKMQQADMSLEVKPKSGSSDFQQTGGTKQSMFSDSASQSFSSLLAQEIKNQAADFVQAGRIVLRDNNAGQIKLQLRPENLGAVKINLEMNAEKKLTGKITVASKEAYEAFSESLNDLLAAFEENGFETGGFDLNWSGQQNHSELQNDINNYFGYNNKKSVPEVMALQFSAEKIYGYGKAESINVIA